MRRTNTIKVVSEGDTCARARHVAVIAPIDHNPYDGFIIKRAQVAQFAGCGHICVPTTRTVKGEPFADECRICASMYNGSQLESSMRHGKMKILIPVGAICYSPTTINMYYCAHTNLHADDCACANTSCAPAGCARKRKDAQLLPRAKSCSQVFFACERDLIACSGEKRGGILQCWNAHLSDEFPVYKCIVALLLVFGLRFDDALPLQETSIPIAYNAQYKIAVACYEHAHERAEVKSVLHALGIETVFAISYREVNELLPMHLFGHRRSYAIACDIVDSMRKLAECVLKCALTRAEIDALLPKDFTRLTEKVQSGRLISREDVAAPSFRELTIDDYKEHTELIKIEPCGYAVIPNVRMRLVRRAHD